MKTTTISQLIRIASQYRAYVRQQCEAPGYYPITIIDGPGAPLSRGDSWHYETKGGRRIHHPSAYSKKGFSSMVYCSSTYRVEVGREWLAARRIPTWAMVPAREAEQLVRLGACGPAGHGALLIGMQTERIVEEIGLQAVRS